MRKNLTVRTSAGLNGEFFAPADKSVSQRAVLIGAVCRGSLRVDNFLLCDDTKRAIAACRSMGVSISVETNARGTSVRICGNGLTGLKAPSRALYIGNSGTTMRLICGILAGQRFRCRLTGDASLSRRPMDRVIVPLTAMGALITGTRRRGAVCPPLTISGRALSGTRYDMPIKSAQVKSCVLLAGILAHGTTTVKERFKTRDHTERMLRFFNASISEEKLTVRVRGGSPLVPSKRVMTVPGDISSAAFFMVAASVVPNSRITIRRVGLNPTRTAVITLLKRMGARITVRSTARSREAYEPYGDIIVRSARLRGITLSGDDVAAAIDELPILCVAACCARGTTRIKGAAELRVKETDRIHSMVTNLRKMGAAITSRGDDLIITGGVPLRGARVESFHDHRTAMCMAVAGLTAEGTTTITDTACISKSFPDFPGILRSLAD